MANGGPMTGGRTVSAMYGGRPVRAFALGNEDAMASLQPNIWPRPSGVCAPVRRCCCKGPWNIGPGEALPLSIVWSPFIDSLSGYVLHSVAVAELLDMHTTPPQPADPEMIKITTGIAADDPEDPDNSDVADLIAIIPPVATQAIIEVGEDTPINRQFRLNIAVNARDCDGHVITLRDCFVIVIAEC